MNAVNAINQAITKWSKEKTKLVVAIDGYTGVGKTTLLDALAKRNPDILAVNRDDFIFPRKTVARMFKTAADKSELFELNVCDTKKIRTLVSSFRAGRRAYHTRVYNPVSGKLDISKRFDTSKKILVIEGVFMFHPKLMLDLWDKRIYLENDSKKIDARRIKREKARWGKDYIPETHPDSYFRHVILALKRYQKLYKPKKVAHLTITV